MENPDIDPTNSSFLTECPIAKYHNGDFYHHDMMLGYTRNEILLFLGRKYHDYLLIIALYYYSV